jgi:hypothetical protein
METSEERDSLNFSEPEINWRTYWKVLIGLIIVCFALAFAQTGCTPKKSVTVPSYAQARAQVLKDGPLIDKPVEERHGFKKGQSTPIRKDEAAPYSGVLLDEKQAARVAAIMKERDRWRKTVKAERLQQRTKDIIHDKALQALQEQAKRTWWERHKGEILLGVGGALGIGLVLGVLYALTKGDGVTTSSHILVQP